jgi:hypothetical protein
VTKGKNKNAYFANMCRNRMRIGIVTLPIRIRMRIWIGINMEIEIRIRIKTMQIHNTDSNLRKEYLQYLSGIAAYEEQ